MHQLAGGGGTRAHTMPMSQSLPSLGGMVGGGDGEMQAIDAMATVGVGDGAAEEMVTAAADEETGPAMVRVPTNKRKAWRNDPRCDPMARFYPKANVDHLLYAEEV